MADTPSRTIMPAMVVFLVGVLWSCATAAPAILSCAATNTLDTLHASYDGITNVSFTVRRSATLENGDSARTVSRVVWARGDRLHSETLSPISRRVIIDGLNVYDKWDGEKKPRVRPLAEQNSIQRVNQRSIPCSPEEFLSEIDQTTGKDTAPPNASVARAVLFSVKQNDQIADSAVKSVSKILLCFDDAGRVVFATMYADEAATICLASIHFHAPLEAIPGGWLYGRIEIEDNRTDSPVERSDSRFDAIRVNQKLPVSQFDPRAFF